MTVPESRLSRLQPWERQDSRGAVGACMTANSRWEIWIEAAGQQVTTSERYVTHALKSITESAESTVSCLYTHAHTHSLKGHHVYLTHISDWEVSFRLPGAKRDGSRSGVLYQE